MAAAAKLAPPYKKQQTPPSPSPSPPAFSFAFLLHPWAYMSLRLVALAVVCAAWAAPAKAGMSADYYSSSCPKAEKIVAEAVTAKQISNPTTAAGLLRLFFHDCFVGGCDASVLIMPNALTQSEREAEVNLSLPGDAFEAIIRAKTALELQCPGVVSCADVLTIATRDAIVMVGGPFYPLDLGRKDGRASDPAAADRGLPHTNATVSQLIALFTANGFTVQEMVALAGSHTLGFSHCSEFADRIYNYNGGGSDAYDPKMNSKYAEGLQRACASYLSDSTIAAFNDIMTPGKFDNFYFKNLQKGLGLLETDAAFYADQRTRPFVDRYAANQTAFFADFKAAIQKLSMFQVKQDGEVRRRCDAYN